MSEALNFVNRTIDEENQEKSAATRREMIAGAGAVIGGMGLMGIASGDALGQGKSSPNTVENITHRRRHGRGAGHDRQHRRAGARRARRGHPAQHRGGGPRGEDPLRALISDAFGGKPATKKIWVPDEVFASQEACWARWSSAIRSSSTPT